SPRRRYSTPVEVAKALEPFSLARPREPKAPQQAVIRAAAANPPRVALQPLAPTIVEETPLIVRSPVRSGGGWGWVVLACTAIVLGGGGLAYWLLQKTPAPTTEKDGTVALTKDDPKSRPQLTPSRDGDGVGKPKEETKPSPKLVPEPVPGPNREPEPKPAPPRIVASEWEQIPAPARVIEPPPTAKTDPPTRKDPRKPVPEGEALAKAEAMLRDLYKDDYARTKQSEQAAFAESLFEQAGEVKRDP